VIKEKSGIYAPVFSKAMVCFQEVENVQFVVGNSVFKCDVYAPNLVQQFNVPLPESEEAEEDIVPSNYPSPFTALSHEHELTLQTNLYGGMGYACEKCQKYGKTYGYHCGICQYDLHPNCALNQ